MKRYKLPLSVQIILIAFIIGLAIITYIDGKPEVVDYSGIEFYGEITNIKKYYRGRYDIELKLKDGKQVVLSDNGFEAYKEKIHIGDSMEKFIGSDCFQYKRNGMILAENCKSIRQIRTLPDNPSPVSTIP